jgi:DNA repair protein RecO (recombination protein O)
MSHRINFEEAFVLHRRPFRDTSLLVNLFSLHYGHVTLLARGARRPKSPLQALLLPFTPLVVSWAGKTDLPTIGKVESTGMQYSLSGRYLLAATYINELLVRLLERFGAYPSLYTFYQETLNALHNQSDLSLILRLFEKKLLAELGYALELENDVSGAAIEERYRYHFLFGSGLKRVENVLSAAKNTFSGKSLLALHRETFTDASELNDAGQLLAVALRGVLGTRPIKSLELFVKY